MEETQTPRGPGRLLVLTGKRSRLESASRFLRNPGVWLHYLYSKVWGDSSRGNGGASSFPNAADVQGTDVFLRARNLRWSDRRHYYSPTLVSLIALLTFSITGCENKRASLEKQYAEARLLFQQGYIDQPLPPAEAGLKKSANYPDLNWKFRVLTAEARNRKKQYSAALEVLEPEPSSGIPSEILWRRRIAQALSLCQSGKDQQTEERFAQAAALHAEPGALNYARGRCAMSQGHLKEAETFLRLVAAQNSNPDPFLKLYALATLAKLATDDLHYDEAIDLNKECLAIFRLLHAPPLEEVVLGNLGTVYVELSDFNNGRKNSEAAEKIAAQLNLLNDQQKWLRNIGSAYSIQGQSGLAEQSYNHALAIATKLGDSGIIAGCLNNLTMVKLNQHQLNGAEKYHLREF